MTKKTKNSIVFALSAFMLACSVGAAVAVKEVKAENVTATYTEGAEQISANLQSLSIDSFASLDDFTDWFAFSYHHSAYAVDDYVTYDETNQSVKINATQDLDFRFAPDELGTGNYFGKSTLGNFEIKMTLKGIDVGASENVYLGSRVQWSSSAAEYFNVQARLTGGTEGAYTLGSSQSYVSGEGKSIDATTVSEGFTVTVGYVNNYAYFYYGDLATNGAAIISGSMTENTTNTWQEGNQTFALYLKAGANIEISDFSYTRLDTAFAFDADSATTLAAVEAIVGDTESEPVEPDTPATPDPEPEVPTEAKTYDDVLDFDFTNAEDATANQEFLSGLRAGVSTYSETGTTYTHELTEEGFVMENTSTNSHGLSYVSLDTEQYVNSAVQISVKVEADSVFELFVRTAFNETNLASKGYHLILESKSTESGAVYNYLKMENRNGSFALLGEQKTLSSGELNFMLVTEKIVEGETSYTKVTVYGEGPDPLFTDTDQDLSETQVCSADLGNIAIGIRNQGKLSGKAMVKKLAIYSNIEDATWPRKDFGGMSVVDKIEDCYYEFGSGNEDKAQEFVEKISVVNVSPKAEGSICVDENGDVLMSHAKLGQYARTQYEFGAISLTNYTVMMEVQVVEGSFVLGIRVPTFQDFTAGNTVYIQMANNGDGSGIYLSMVNRTNSVYKSYFDSYNVGSDTVCLRLIVDGGRISILVDEKLCLYNAYYVDEDGVRDWDVDGYENYDTTVATSGGDFVMGVMNDLKTDVASTKIKRFAFYNGATAEENVEINYAGQDLTDAEKADLVAEAEKNMQFTDGFYIPFTAEIGLAKQYSGQTNFKVGDTIKINISEYFSMNVLMSDITVTEMGFRGTYTDGIWSYTFTEADKDQDFAFAISVSHPKATPVVLRFNVSTKEVANNDEKKGGCGSVIGMVGSGISLLACGAALLLKKKKEN